MARRPRGRRLGFQLNLANVFDRRDPLITRAIDVNARRFIYREIVPPPTTWRLTTNVEFSIRP